MNDSLPPSGEPAATPSPMELMLQTVAAQAQTAAKQAETILVQAQTIERLRVLLEAEDDGDEPSDDRYMDGTPIGGKN